MSFCSYFIYFERHDCNCNICELCVIWNFQKMPECILPNATSLGPNEKAIALQLAQTFKFWTKNIQMLYFREVYTYKWIDSEKRLPPIERANFSWDFNTWELSFLVFVHKPHLNIGEIGVTFCNCMSAIFLPLFALFSGFYYEGWNFNRGNYLFTTDTK